MWQLAKNLFSAALSRKKGVVDFRQVFEHFQTLLRNHQTAMELIADLGEKSGGDYIFDRKYLSDSVQQLQDLLLHMIKSLNLIASNRYAELYATLDNVFLPIEAELKGRIALQDAPYVVHLTDDLFEAPELLGGKAHRLAQVIQRLRLPVPNGFVVTNKAYHRYLEYNDLADKIHAWVEAWASGEEELERTSVQIRYSILAGIVPPDLFREIQKHAHKAANSWAVRSSAHGEDGELSFAGLHESLLNVLPDQIPEAYKRVLASLYSAESLSYRHQMGVLGEEPAMAVLCQEMIQSRASGVIQTSCVDPLRPDCLTIYASFGLGRTVVEGKGEADTYFVEKYPPHAITMSLVSEKEYEVTSAVGGGEEETHIPQRRQNEPAISEATIQLLAKWGVALERYFKRPQEIEWAEDEKGAAWILQSRDLVLSKSADRPEQDVCDSCASYPVLVRDKGVVAHAGVGSGKVFVIQSNEDMKKFPEGAVLVAKYTAPWLAQVVPSAAAIITERGSAAGHLATIAREFRVPALLNVDDACSILTNGTEITLDTHHRTIYLGRVKELIQYELLQSTVFEESAEFRLLRRLLKRIAPLHLVDPHSPDFTPKGCKSAHDLIRFIHEKAIQELMDLPSFVHRFQGVKIWTLVSEVPIDLKIFDLDDAISPDVEGDKVVIDQVNSPPLQALWTGVSRRDVWSTEPVDLDLRGLMSSLTRNWDAQGQGASASNFNLAVVNKSYLNLHLRLGYHFNLIDVMMDEEPRHNYIYFRFVGGVTDITRRSRRAQLLENILSRYHFNAVTKGDLIVARLLHLPKKEIEHRLQVLGALIGFTRQLDIQLRSDDDIERFVQEFFNRHDQLARSLS